MKKAIYYLSYSIFTLLLFNNCASIVSDSTYPFTVNTSPADATVVIKNDKGLEIYSGKSPATVRLKASSGFFKRAFYTVTVSGNGYDPQTLPINFRVDGWYWGNLLIGGVIGMLIVDPATGAMYKLDDEYISVNLRKSTTSIDQPEFKVYDLTTIPNQWKEQLVKVNP